VEGKQRQAIGWRSCRRRSGSDNDGKGSSGGRNDDGERGSSRGRWDDDGEGGVKRQQR
jgi:hypothetical protein